MTPTPRVQAVSDYAIVVNPNDNVAVVKRETDAAVFERMPNDLDLSAGGVIDGRETIDEVGRQVFEHMIKVADGELLAKAEINKHREFQF
jgi:altronate dehydratase